MLRIVLLCTVVGVCLGQATLQGSCCSGDDRKLVIEQWNKIWNTPDSSAVKITIAHAVFDRFLKENPDAKSVFARVDVENPSGGVFRAHMMRVLSGMDLVVNNLAYQQVLDEQMAHLTAQHAVREGVNGDRMRAFLTILMQELPKIIPDFNSDAWGGCFKLVFEKISP